MFTTPDPERVDGVVRATKPRELDGTIVRDFEVRFEGGRVASIEAGRTARCCEAYAGRDEGAGRLGEIALVDGEGRIGHLDTVFYDTLLDENAASHIALGQGFDWARRRGRPRRASTVSEIHIDFMIGSPEVDVTGVTGARRARAACCAPAPGRSSRRATFASGKRGRPRRDSPDRGQARLRRAGAHAVDRRDDLGRIEVVVAGRGCRRRRRSEV